MRTFLPTITFLQKTYLIVVEADSSFSETIFAAKSVTLVLEDWVLRVHISDSTCAELFDPAV